VFVETVRDYGVCRECGHRAESGGANSAWSSNWLTSAITSN
jgi:hypothetical protein